MKHLSFRFRWKEELLVSLMGGVCAASLFCNILLFNQNALLRRTYDHLYKTFCEICMKQQAELSRKSQLNTRDKPWEKAGGEEPDPFDEQR